LLISLAPQTRGKIADLFRNPAPCKNEKINTINMPNSPKILPAKTVNNANKSPLFDPHSSLFFDTGLPNHLDGQSLLTMQLVCKDWKKLTDQKLDPLKANQSQLDYLSRYFQAYTDGKVFFLTTIQHHSSIHNLDIGQLPPALHCHFEAGFPCREDITLWTVDKCNFYTLPTLGKSGSGTKKNGNTL
jgi:hypothetical protein